MARAKAEENGAEVIVYGKDGEVVERRKLG